MIVTCGESLVDLIPERNGDDVLYRPVLGGSHYTVALGIARLGGASGYLWELSRDELGRRFFASLEGAGVDCSMVRRSERPTPVAVVDDTGPEARYNIADPGRVMHDTELPPLSATARCLSIGSAVLAQEPVGSRIEALARTAPLITIDYNARPPSITDAAAYRARLRRLAALSGVVKASVTDIEVIGEGDGEAYMRELIEAGTSMAILTAAEGGATAYTRRGSAHVPSRCGRLVDTVGAGDSFMAALLYRLQRDDALSRERLAAYDAPALAGLITFAQAAAAFTCGRTGAAMPCRADLDDLVECH